MATTTARLCSSCGMGSKKDNCVKCGERISPRCGSIALICGNCNTESENLQKKCIKCGKTLNAAAVMAKVCDSCNSGDKKNECAKCGKKV